MINIILILLFLLTLHFLLKKSTNKIDNNESFLNNPQADYCSKSYDDINFNYEINPKIITDNNDNTDKINYNMIKSWQPNIYYDNITSTHKKFSSSDELLNHNSILYKHNNKEDTNNLKIREIYDNKIIDFKKNISQKHINNNNIISCGSNLKAISPNDWNYDDEKPENGGEINSGLYAFDPLINQSVALC